MNYDEIDDEQNEDFNLGAVLGDEDIADLGPDDLEETQVDEDTDMDWPDYDETDEDEFEDADFGDELDDQDEDADFEKGEVDDA